MKKIILITLAFWANYGYSQCFVKIANGNKHALAIADDGSLWGWGSNNVGEAGIPDSGNFIRKPTRVGTKTNWKEISCGGNHSMALNTDNELYTWGFNFYGQLGLGNLNNAYEPVKVDGEWKYIEAGDFTSFAIDIDGRLLGCGSGENGRMGGNQNKNYQTFTQVANGNDWKAVSSNGAFTLALKTNGSLFATGNNGNGQFGNGNTTNSNFWIAAASTLTNIDKIYTGNAYSCVITNNGSLYSWGANNMGQLGHNGTTQQTLPVIAANNVKDVVFGQSSTMWMKDSGVYSCGSNTYFQARPGSNGIVTTPYKWPNFDAPKLIAMGMSSSMVVTEQGLFTWGLNDRGICATGNLTDVTSPTLAVPCAPVISAIKSLNTKNTIVLYPNPASEFITIASETPTTFKLVNGNGIEILTFSIEQNYSLPITQLSAGVYFLQSKEGSLKKFIKL
jgi:alpha-tubulin suppressor-like RCC1 family protein